MFLKQPPTKPTRKRPDNKKNNPRVKLGILKFKCQGDKVDTKYSIL